MKKTQIFKGAATALITPMKNGNIDYPALTRLVEAQISAGIAALVVGGTTGEAATLSDGERYELYSYVKEKVGGRAKNYLRHRHKRHAHGASPHESCRGHRL